MAYSEDPAVFEQAFDLYLEEKYPGGVRPIDHRG